MSTKELEIDAVHDRDLLKLLNELGLAEQIRSGALVCPVCEKVITFDNIGVLQVVEGNVTIYCDDFACVPEGLNQ